MEEEFCLYCGGPIEEDSHGNRKYCSDECYNNQKLYRNSLKYSEQKKVSHALKKADEILSLFFNANENEQYVDAVHLESAGMPWDINKEIITIDSLPVKVIGEFGYCLFTNETIKIWNLPSQKYQSQQPI